VDARTRAVQAPSTAMIVASEVDPRADLARERASATFPARELAALLAGGEDKLVLREKVGDAVRAHPVFSKKGKYFMERADLYRTTLEKYLALPALAAELGARGVGDPMAIGRVIREMIDEPGGLDLHLGMFIPTIQGQADEEQKKFWMPRCVALKIIGTYAQTELGHGTYIRGLGTTRPPSNSSSTARRSPPRSGGPGGWARPRRTPSSWRVSSRIAARTRVRTRSSCRFAPTKITRRCRA
jgi:acyl-CoA oxidase